MGEQEVEVGGEAVFRILRVKAVVAVALVGPLVADVAGSVAGAVILIEDRREILQQRVVEMVGAFGGSFEAVGFRAAGLTLLLVFPVFFLLCSLSIWAGAKITDTSL